MVTAELEKYQKLYDENIKEINSLRRALAELENRVNDDGNNEAVFEEDATFVEIEPESVIEEIEKDEAPITLADVVLEGVSQYAAEIIGKIVLEGASLSSKFAEKPNEYSKDLINLVLGKTEVCKGVILDICNDDSDESVKRAQIDVVYTEAVEYFKSLNEQV